MTSTEFQKRAVEIVLNYAIEHIDKTDDVPPINVYTVWYAFILGRMKALLSTDLRDGMYYEVTYNPEKNEIYLDAYKKFENRKVDV